MKTPLLFLIFNRPDLTSIVFEEIRKQKPQQLFIAADGPREVPGEREICESARNLVINNVDWECEVKTLFRDKNLGCGRAVSEAITWFFKNVEEGIILEDDCLPNESFFTFCSELLAHYRDNNKIMHISGNNFQDGIWRGDGSYYYSQFPHIWGWATWKRAWSLYDLSLRNFPKFEKDKALYKVIKDKNQVSFWLDNFKASYFKAIDTWDHAWSFSFLSNNGYAILPNVNLVSNIGFGPNATHTYQKDSRLENLPSVKLDNLVHPIELKLNFDADNYTYYQIFHNHSNNNNNSKAISIIMERLFLSTKFCRKILSAILYSK
ncbi:MAG: protein containing nucleotide-diphospho-sugar transferase domain [Sphingobacteriales bacterium]|nr:protein containing nucleotide-diphospho-sugar transferase domain [Sphingobacteriales bacterium]